MLSGKLVAHLCDVHKVSQRRACHVLAGDRSRACATAVYGPMTLLSYRRQVCRHLLLADQSLQAQ